MSAAGLDASGAALALAQLVVRSTSAVRRWPAAWSTWTAPAPAASRAPGAAAGEPPPLPCGWPVRLRLAGT